MEGKKTQRHKLCYFFYTNSFVYSFPTSNIGHHHTVSLKCVYPETKEMIQPVDFQNKIIVFLGYTSIHYLYELLFSRYLRFLNQKPGKTGYQKKADHV